MSALPPRGTGSGESSVECRQSACSRSKMCDKRHGNASEVRDSNKAQQLTSTAGRGFVLSQVKVSRLQCTEECSLGCASRTDIVKPGSMLSSTFVMVYFCLSFLRSFGGPSIPILIRYRRRGDLGFWPFWHFRKMLNNAWQLQARFQGRDDLTCDYVVDLLDTPYPGHTRVNMLMEFLSEWVDTTTCIHQGGPVGSASVYDFLHIFFIFLCINIAQMEVAKLNCREDLLQISADI